MIPLILPIPTYTNHIPKLSMFNQNQIAMKKLNFLLTFLVILAISCTKDDLLNTEQSTDQLLSNDNLKYSGSVIKVMPNGTDDTQTLVDAFAIAKASCKNAVVKLMPGTFYIGMIEVKEFNGTLTGSGKEGSIITNLPDLSPDAVIIINKLPALITFIGGDVTVSDLTVKLSEGLSWLGTQEMNMLLFSDYSADFMPARKHIQVKLNNIEVIGLLNKDVEIWEGGPVIDYPYNSFHGAKFAPDMQLLGNTVVPRCNIDADITNSKFSKFSKGVYVWGCKRGNLSLGEKGGNIFIENIQGLVVNENIGVHVKIMNNEFTIPDFYWNGVDLNTGEALYDDIPLENVQVDIGTYEIRYNIFNVYYSNGMGIMDAWRYVHPENPLWMKMIWDNNTFNALADGAWVGLTFNLKNALFLNNTIVGDASDGLLANYGIYYIDPSDPNYLLSWSEGCRFLNNKFMQKDLLFYMDSDTKDWLVMGDLSNIIVEDHGVNNRFIGKTKPGHTNAKRAMNPMDRMERMQKMIRSHKSP
jgi:hypothetical protein